MDIFLNPLLYLLSFFSESNLAINVTATNNKFEIIVPKNRNAKSLGLLLFISPFRR